MNDSLPSLSITMKMYGWSKWGGARMGLAKEDLDEWYCQICGEKQTRTLPSYMFPLDCSNRDFARVCAKCKSRGKGAKIYWDLVELIKHI